VEKAGSTHVAAAIKAAIQNVNDKNWPCATKLGLHFSKGTLTQFEVQSPADLQYQVMSG